MRVSILGASGLLGLALHKAFSALGWTVSGTGHHRTPGGLAPLDLLDADAVEHFLDRTAPMWVAIPAANPHVDLCEREPAQTRALNVEATIRAVESANGRGARVLFFSSDYVFDGKKGLPYIEDDAPAPLNEYGRQKLAVERAALAGAAGNVVVRTSGLYGWQHERKNFVLQVLDRLAAGKPVQVGRDVVSNPTYADDLAELAAGLLGRGASGIYHAVGSESVSREAFVARIASSFGFPSPEVEFKDFAHAAARPKLSALSTAKLERLLGRRPLGVEAGLTRMRFDEKAWKARWDLVSS